MDIRNPILDSSPAYEELGPTRHSTSSDPPRPRPSAETKRLIGELGLRFPPAAGADLTAHAGTLALLAVDLAHVPPRFLDRAIREWAGKSRFLPKASELIELASSYLDKPKAEEADLEALAERYNAGMSAASRAKGLRWVVENGDLTLTGTGSLRSRLGEPITATQEEITAYAKRVQEARRNLVKAKEA